jgi:hypothetical protein
VVGETVTVASRRLVWDGSRLAESRETVERASWSLDGLSLIDAPAVGDLVALHWDWVCEVIDDEQAERISVTEELQRASAGLGG